FSEKSHSYTAQDLRRRRRRRRTAVVGTQVYGKFGNEWESEAEGWPRSVIEFACERGKGHPSQKPVPLFEYLIRTYSNEGETVLDNVMGSGTTGVACVRTGRDFIGIEKDAGYFAIASKRIADEQAKTAL